jgi:hypothetical protein
MALRDGMVACVKMTGRPIPFGGIGERLGLGCGRAA